MSSNIVEYQGAAIATVNEVVAQTLRVKEIMNTVMKPNVHYGIIPGTKKNTLYKPGAETLCVAFHIAPTYPDVVEDRFDDGVRYRVKCVGVHQSTGIVLAEGLGSCSSMEEKYKWRKTYIQKEFDATSPDRRRLDYWQSNDGREGANMQVRTEVADIENTLLKMASKRAFIAMVLNAVAASDVFAQDLEDLSAKVLSTMVEAEGAGEGDKKKTLKQPASKSGTGTVDTATGEVKESPIASAGQLKHTANKLEGAGKTMADALAHFKHADESKLTAAQCNEITAWAAQPPAEKALAEQS